MELWQAVCAVLWLFCFLLGHESVAAGTSPKAPLVIVRETKEVQVAGIIYPARFNAAQGEEAHYHLLVWRGGTSTNALIETAADDLAFHDALLDLGGQPGNNLTMAAWHERYDRHSPAPLMKVSGSPLDVRLSWEGNAPGIALARAFRHPGFVGEDSRTRSPDPELTWRFAGNRARWFNHLPLAPRPGCLACLYSCPSGKVSNGALSIRDYVLSPSRFYADTDVLPPDGTAVVVTFRLLP